MKHSIRSRTVDPIRGHVTKVEKVFGELGSGILDKNGREIFEGDRVKDWEGYICPVTFEEGVFYFGDLLVGDYPTSLEIVGHVDD